MDTHRNTFCCGFFCTHHHSHICTQRRCRLSLIPPRRLFWSRLSSTEGGVRSATCKQHLAQLVCKIAMPWSMRLLVLKHAPAQRRVMISLSKSGTCSQQGQAVARQLNPFRSLHGSTCSFITRGILSKMPFVTLGICSPLAEGCADAHVVPTL